MTFEDIPGEGARLQTLNARMRQENAQRLQELVAFQERSHALRREADRQWDEHQARVSASSDRTS